MPAVDRRGQQFVAEAELPWPPASPRPGRSARSRRHRARRRGSRPPRRRCADEDVGLAASSAPLRRRSAGARRASGHRHVGRPARRAPRARGRSAGPRRRRLAARTTGSIMCRLRSQLIEFAEHGAAMPARPFVVARSPRARRVRVPRAFRRSAPTTGGRSRPAPASSTSGHVGRCRVRSHRTGRRRRRRGGVRLARRHRRVVARSQPRAKFAHALVDGQLAEEPGEHDLALDPFGRRGHLVDHCGDGLDQAAAHFDGHDQRPARRAWPTAAAARQEEKIGQSSSPTGQFGALVLTSRKHDEHSCSSCCLGWSRSPPSPRTSGSSSSSSSSSSSRRPFDP